MSHLSNTVEKNPFSLFHADDILETRPWVSPCERVFDGHAMIMDEPRDKRCHKLGRINPPLLRYQKRRDPHFITICPRGEKQLFINVFVMSMALCTSRATTSLKNHDWLYEVRRMWSSAGVLNWFWQLANLCRLLWPRGKSLNQHENWSSHFANEINLIDSPLAPLL